MFGVRNALMTSDNAVGRTCPGDVPAERNVSRIVEAFFGLDA